MRKLLWLLPLCFLWVASTEPRRQLSMRVAFGYKDARPARLVGDLYERLHLVRDALKPCAGGEEGFCGFRRDPDDGDLFYRSQRSKRGERLVIYLRMTGGSAGPDDEANRGDRFQSDVSRASEENFLTGVARAEPTFYIGHSRDGGGPDFYPPRLKRDDHVDYDWYRKNKPGLSKLLAALRKSPGRAGARATLGLMSCRSSQLFQRPLHRAGAKVNLVASDELLYYTEGLDVTKRALAKLIRENL